MDARGPGLLRQARDELLHLLAHDHHHVGQLVHHHHDVGQRGERRRGVVLPHRLVEGIEDGLAGGRRLAHLAVEAVDVAHLEVGHELVAALHLRHAPAEGIGRLLHVGDHRRQQVGDAVVDGQLQHLGIDEDQAHLLGAGVVEDGQQHGVERHRLAGAGGAGHQQVRHACQVGHHRLAADVLAQGQGQGRGRLLEGARAQHLRQPHRLAHLVGHLQADGGAARNHLHHAHADGRQGAGQVLGQVGDLAHLHPRRRLQLEAGDHGARVHRHHFDADAEVGQLELHLARHGLQRLVGQAVGVGLGLVQQGQRRQLAVGLDLEQGHLALALHPLARLHPGHGGLDPRRRPPRLLLLDHGHALARGLLARLPRAPLAPAAAHRRQPAARPVEQGQGGGPGEVHEADPGQVREQGDPGEKPAQEQQGRPQGAEGPGHALPHQVAQDAPGAHGQAAAGVVQRGQAAAGGQGQQKAAAAQGHRPRVHRAVGAQAAVDEPAGVGQHDRKQVGHVAEQAEEDVGEPGPRGAAQVAHRGAGAAVGPARVARMVGGQGQQQVGGGEARHHQRPLLDAAPQVARQRGPRRGLLVSCLGQDSVNSVSQETFTSY